MFVLLIYELIILGPKNLMDWTNTYAYFPGSSIGFSLKTWLHESGFTMIK